MPRLPVASCAALLCLAIVVLATAASARVAVRSIEDLRLDPEVAALETRFLSLVSSETLFTRCGDAYSITPEQRAYNTQRLATITRQYADSYYTTYVKMVSAPPPQKIVDYYMQYISNEQQATVLQMETLIKESCTKGQLTRLAKETEKARIAELAAQAAAKDKKPYDPWKPAPIQAPAQVMPQPIPGPTGAIPAPDPETQAMPTGPTTVPAPQK